MADLIQHPTLYNIDSKGKVRIWRMESEGNKHRTISGLIDGKQVTSGWVFLEGKNVGKKNGTTPEEQCLLDVERDYTKKLERKYYESLADAEAAGSGTKFLTPMLAHRWDQYLDRKKATPLTAGVWVQPKLDGFRSLTSQEGMNSRNGKPIVSCPHINEELRGLFKEINSDNHQYILDGELYNHDLHDDFDELSSVLGQKKPTEEDVAKAAELAQYHVYDVIGVPGSYRERKEFIEQVIAPMFSGERMIKFVPSVWCISLDEVDAQHDKNLEEGYEGSIIRFDTEYEHTRTWNLIKRKEFFDAEYLVKEILQGQGNWHGIAKKAICVDPKTNEEFEAGLRGTMDANRKLLEDFNNGICPKEATVRYPNLTPRGVPRFGQITKWWPNGRDL